MRPEVLASSTGATLERAQHFANVIDAAMAEFGICLPRYQAAFLAQVGHESGGLHWMRELWGPTPAQRGYEGRADLGNMQPGDGFRYRGGGLIQTTGRDNFHRVGIALGLPLEDEPDLITRPDVAARSAGLFWQDHELNAFVDSNDFVGLTRRINGGTNGLAEREALWTTAKAALGVPA